MDHVGVELGDIAPDPWRDRDRDAIFIAGRDRDCRNADQVAGRRKSRMLHGRRINPDLHALPQQVADEAVQGLVGAIADVIVIAREEGEAEVARLHGAGCRGFLVSVKFGLPPIARSDARLFVLGSLPGDASLAARRYYAHPTNQFWRLLGLAIGEGLAELDYEGRLERLAERRIGLWDVIASATRRGSLDQAIREAQHNRIKHLLHDFPALQEVCFNGA